MTGGHNALWSDEPAGRDLLSFMAVAETVADAVLDDTLDPIALGLSGSWGAGKTSVLELVKQEVQGGPIPLTPERSSYRLSRGAMTQPSGLRRAS